jgi:hypothetical protein
MLPQRRAGRDLFWWLTRLGVMRVTAGSRLGRRVQARGEFVIGTNRKRLERAGVRFRPRLVDAEGRTVRFANHRLLEDVGVVVWATGYRSDYGWIHIPGVVREGHVVHRRGVSEVPGLYFLGLSWQHTRGSACSASSTATPPTWPTASPPARAPPSRPRPASPSSHQAHDAAADGQPAGGAVAARTRAVGRGLRRHPGPIAAGLWWLEPATVYALSLTLIAAVYIGFGVADGRPHWPWVQGPLAAPEPLCGQHSLVAAVLPGRRLVAAAILVVLITVGVDFTTRPMLPGPVAAGPRPPRC